jgi:hypothetical protein
MDSIQRQFKGGPPHHHPSSQEIDISSNTRSSIFVTTPEKAAKLSTMQKQDIFRHRHILESASEWPTFKFDHQALLKLGALTAERDILGVYPLF